MRKLKRPKEPEAFTQAVAELLHDYPPACAKSEADRWSALRDTPAYSAAQEALHENQSGICAYCEILLRENNMVIEHFIPKSKTTAAHDLTFSFSNFLLCCKGGTNKYAPEKDESGQNTYEYDPDEKTNHSCDVVKGNCDPIGKCLNPYELPGFPIFKINIDMNGRYFVPDGAACVRAKIDPALAQSTLDILNLNCPRLNKRRRAIWNGIEQELADAQILPQDEQPAELASIAKAHLQDNPVFYTTKLLCLADAMPHLIP